MKILTGVIKVAVGILALPWLYAVACKVFSGGVINAYAEYGAWVAGIAWLR